MNKLPPYTRSILMIFCLLFSSAAKVGLLAASIGVEFYYVRSGIRYPFGARLFVEALNPSKFSVYSDAMNPNFGDFRNSSDFTLLKRSIE